MHAGQHAARASRRTLVIVSIVLGLALVAAGLVLVIPSANASAILTSTRNILVGGTLSMRPASASVVQTIRFTGVNEARIGGGGMDPVDSGDDVSIAPGLRGIRRIDLYVDGAREQADNRAPYLFAWPSFALPAGSHDLRAVLVRSDGSSVRSSPITVETTGH